MKLLKHKTALVTGAGSGIGRAIALKYAEEGASVVISDVNAEAGKETVDMIAEEGGKAFFIKADTSVAADCEALVKKTIKKFGALHVACNNAGIGGDIKYTGDYPADSWEKVIGVNLSGVFYGMRYQIPAMLEAGGGSIVNISSVLGQVAAAGSVAYVAAKHGVVGITQTAAVEYASRKIRVNAVGPGYIKTPLLGDMDKDTMDALVRKHPMGRLGKAEEVAELVLWLSSPKASFVTGGYYPIDGGYLAQ